jgi:DNA-binding CsgD family transcriptional regulator
MRLLDEALAATRDAVQRADIQHIRGRILVSQGHSDIAFRLLKDESARIRYLDPDRTATMLADACLHCVIDVDMRRLLPAAREARSVAAGARPHVQAYAALMLACALIMTGERAKASNLLDEFLPVLRQGDPLTESGMLVGLAAQCYSWLERHDVASELLATLIASARNASAPAALLLPLSCRAELDLRAGRWLVAAAQLHEITQLGYQLAEWIYAGRAVESLAWLAAAAGDERRCHYHVAHAMRLIDEQSSKALGQLCIDSALGLLELGLGRVGPAIQNLEHARELAERHGLTEPNIVHWQADLIEAYARAGDRIAARDVLETLERKAQHTGCRWALGTAARCRGLLTEDPSADGCFDAALEHLKAVQAPFEIARTQLCRAERLRRAGHRSDARPALRNAIEMFDRLGAQVWAARARTELRATGAKPKRRHDYRDRDELTAHEFQVAVVVAGGASNREAAAALFLSTKTIEFHLARVYRKLRVRGRTELAALAVRRGWLDAQGHATHQD